MTALGAILCSVAMGLMVIAGVGILRLPDAMARQHAATKAGTLAVTLFALGLALVAREAGWGWAWVARLAGTVLILLMTLPLASHALARAGCVEVGRPASSPETGCPAPPR